MKKSIDNIIGDGYFGVTVAESTVRFRRWNDTEAHQRLPFLYGAFLVPCNSIGGLCAGAFGLAGSLGGRSSNRVWPAFFRLDADKADFLNLNARRFVMPKATRLPSPRPFNPDDRMSSKEIAELMEKRHDHVMRDIKTLVRDGAIGRPNYGESSYTNSQNKKQPMYELDFQATMTLITGYDAKRRSLVINRWIKLETGTVEPALKQRPKPLSPKQQERVRNAVKAKVESLFTDGSLMHAGYKTIWCRIKEHFQVETYKDVPGRKTTELIEYVQDMELVKPQALKQIPNPQAEEITMAQRFLEIAALHVQTLELFVKEVASCFERLGNCKNIEMAEFYKERIVFSMEGTATTIRDMKWAHNHLGNRLKNDASALAS